MLSKKLRPEIYEAYPEEEEEVVEEEE